MAHEEVVRDLRRKVDQINCDLEAKKSESDDLLRKRDDISAQMGYLMKQRLEIQMAIQTLSGEADEDDWGL